MSVTPKKLTGDLAQATIGTLGSDQNIIGLMDWTIDAKIKMVDGTTTDGLGSEFSLPSTVSWSAKSKWAYVDGDPGQASAILQALQLQATPLNWNFYPTQGTGRAVWSGPAYIDGLTISGGGVGKPLKSRPGGKQGDPIG